MRAQKKRFLRFVDAGLFYHKFAFPVICV